MAGFSDSLIFNNPNRSLSQFAGGSQYGSQATQSDFGQYGGDTDTGLGDGSLSLTDKFGIGLKGIGALSEILKGFSSMNTNKLLQQQLDMAQEQFGFAKDMANKNYSNQLKSFNTALSDRSNTRAFVEGRDQRSADEYYNKNRLTGE